MNFKGDSRTCRTKWFFAATFSQNSAVVYMVGLTGLPTSSANLSKGWARSESGVSPMTRRSMSLSLVDLPVAVEPYTTASRGGIGRHSRIWESRMGQVEVLSTRSFKGSYNGELGSSAKDFRFPSRLETRIPVLIMDSISSWMLDGWRSRCRASSRRYQMRSVDEKRASRIFALVVGRRLVNEIIRYLRIIIR